jgi:hypothetical protein
MAWSLWSVYNTQVRSAALRFVCFVLCNSRANYSARICDLFLAAAACVCVLDVKNNNKIVTLT